VVENLCGGCFFCFGHEISSQDSGITAVLRFRLIGERLSESRIVKDFRNQVFRAGLAAM